MESIKKGDIITVYLGGRKWKVEIENVLPNGKFIVEIFGLKTLHISDIVTDIKK
jgi:hypothetical protein